MSGEEGEEFIPLGKPLTVTLTGSLEVICNGAGGVSMFTEYVKLVSAGRDCESVTRTTEVEQYEGVHPLDQD